MGRGVGLSVRSGWMMGEGTESALRLYFHLRKTGRISTKIHILHQIIFFTLTRIEIVKKKLYLSPNHGSEMSKTFWVRGHT